MYKELLVFPVLGACIGWLTNVVAIKLMFRPRHPVKLGPFKIQGLLPKRKNQIAVTIGQVIESQLVPKDKLMEHVLEARVTGEISQSIIEYFNENVLIRLIPPKILNKVMTKTVNLAMPVIENSAEGALKRLDIKEIVEAEILRLDVCELERLVSQVTCKELRFIEYSGAVLGFLVGMVQFILVRFLF